MEILQMIFMSIFPGLFIACILMIYKTVPGVLCVNQEQARTKQDEQMNVLIVVWGHSPLIRELCNV